MNPKTILIPCVALAALVMAPTDAAAQRHGRPAHVVTHHGATHHGPGPVHVERVDERAMRRALANAQDRIDRVRDQVAPFDEPESRRALRDAERALADARNEISPYGSERRFYHALDLAEQHADTAARRARELVADLERMITDAERRVRRASRAVSDARSQRGERSVRYAEDALASAERSLRYGDYTSARAHLNDAVSHAEQALTLARHTPEPRYDRGHDRYGGGYGSAPVPATYRPSTGDCPSTRPRSW